MRVHTIGNLTPCQHKTHKRCQPAAAPPSGRLCHVAPCAAGKESPIRRMRQRVERKQLQKQAQQEYLRTVYEQATIVDQDNIYIALGDPSPIAIAEQAATEQLAALNQQLQQQISAAATQQDLLDLLQTHEPSINYLNAVAACRKAAALAAAVDNRGSHNHTPQSVSTAPPASSSQMAGPSGAEGAEHGQQLPHQQDQQQQKHPALLAILQRLVLQHSTTFQAPHFAEVASSLSALGSKDHSFWQAFAHACERKLSALPLTHLVTVLCAFVTVNFTPTLNWLERAYYQAKKHLPRGTAGDYSGLVWAWAQLGYTPRDKAIINSIKDWARRRLKKQEYTGSQLVQLLHGMARLPRYSPNSEWLAVFGAELQQHLEMLPPADVLDAWVSLTVMGHSVTGDWMAACLQALQPSLHHTAKVAAAGIDTPGAGAAAVAVPAGQALHLAEPTPAATRDAANPAAAAASAQGLSGDQLAVLGWCLAGVQEVPPEEWMEAYAAAVYSAVPTMSAENVVDVLWGCAGLQFVPGEELLQQLLGCAQAGMAQLKSDGVQRLSLALVKLLPLQLLQPLTDGLAAAAGSDSGASSSTTSSSSSSVTAVAPGGPADDMSTWGPGVSLPEGFLRALQVRSHQVMVTSSAAQLADVLVLFAAASRQPGSMQQQPDSGAAVSQAAGATGSMTSGAFLPGSKYLSAVAQQTAVTAAACNPAASAQLLWAFAVLQYKPAPQLLHALLEVLSSKLHLLSVGELSGVAWALSCLRHRPNVKWLGYYLTEAAAKLRYCSNQGLTDMLWALACFGAQPGAAWLQQVLQLVGLRVGSMSARQVAVVVWALQQLEYDPAPEDVQVLQLLVGQLAGAQGAGGPFTAAQEPVLVSQAAA